ncbi:MAG: hypothetical protein J6Y91_04890 [Alphaproteobacteria bacterium]|nr:hypothetical protein [Alphaproteobacteria bacterium]
MLLFGRYTFYCQTINTIIMEVELGAPCFRAVVRTKPQLNNDRTEIVFQAVFRRSRTHREFTAEINCREQADSGQALLELRPGDEAYISPNGDDACNVIKHNRLMRWLLLALT